MGKKAEIIRNKIIYRKRFGSVDVMFHAEETVCQDFGCTDKSVDPTFTIRPGQTFKLKKHSGSVNFYKLIATYDSQDEPWGVISQRDLARLIAQGIVTKLTQNHPRYFIEKVDAPLADVNCSILPKTAETSRKTWLKLKMK